MARVLLAMSGGVDSSVAAVLLQEAGHDVVGVFMRHGPAASAERCRLPGSSELPVLAARQGCCTAADAEDARRVADRLGIPFYAIDLTRDFDQIIDYFAAEYAAGRTPNPCIMCNHTIKFGRLFEFADGIGASHIATGHHARVDHEGGRVVLRRGRDRSKDQAYVLFGIPRDRLAHVLLPVGEWTKAAIRRIARKHSLAVADKADSQEICFVPPEGYGALVAARRPEAAQPGEIVTVAGEVVGTHRGIQHFTIGQRKGLGVAFGKPAYVVRIDPATRRVVVGDRRDLACRTLVADDARWLLDPPDRPTACTVQFRYNSSPVTATVERLDEHRFAVAFDAPCYGVSAGQAAVVFRGDCVWGGGWIATAPNAATESV